MRELTQTEVEVVVGGGPIVDYQPAAAGPIVDYQPAAGPIVDY